MEVGMTLEQAYLAGSDQLLHGNLKLGARHRCRHFTCVHQCHLQSSLGRWGVLLQPCPTGRRVTWPSAARLRAWLLLGRPSRGTQTLEAMRSGWPVWARVSQPTPATLPACCLEHGPPSQPRLDGMTEPSRQMLVSRAVKHPAGYEGNKGRKGRKDPQCC